MSNPQIYLISAIFFVMIFSPLVQTSEESLGMPSENIHLVDKRLQLVYSDPSRAVELGLSPAPEGKFITKSPTFHRRVRR